MISSSTPISTLSDFITKENLDIIESANFTVSDYKNILEEIYDETVENLVFDEKNSALDSIKQIVSQHVNIYYSDKEIGAGYYIYNRMYINDQMPESQQIVTLIHELAHHIYAEIFEKWLSKLFNVRHFCVIESLVMFMLNNSIENRVANEYLSYIVESRFTPPEYQNYLSFIQLIVDLKIDVESSKGFFIFAHEISHDIDDLLKPVIDDNLRSKISNQFVVDDMDMLNQKLTFDYADERFSDKEKVEFMQEMIYFIFDYFVNGEGNIEDLEDYIDEFDM